jgi:cytochrome c554/c'-like protein
MDSQILLVAALLAVAAVPLLAPLKLVPSRGLRIAGAAGWVAIALFVTAAARSYRDPREEASRLPVVTCPIERPEDGYVTSKRCRACHADEYASWHASFHRRMTQAVEPETLQGPIDGQHLSWRGREFDVERQGDDYFVTMDDEDAKGHEKGAAARVTRRLALTTGSHHYEVYWYEEGATRKVSLLPFCWRVEAKRFIPIDSAFLIPPAEEQGSEARWNLACNKCHTVHTQPRIAGQFQMDTTSAEFGIACEACHGPGERHVEKNASVTARYAAHLLDDENSVDDTIVNPVKLSPVRDAMVCGQCHAAVLDKDEATMREWLRRGFSYRPGDDLGKTRILRDTGAEKFWSDGQIRTSGREYNALLHSPCYTHQDEQRGIMTCLSCHEMHKKPDDPRSDDEWAEDMLKPGMRGDSACTQCHADYRDEQKVAAHSHHAAGSEGSRCQNCHMPLTTYGLLKTERSHTITSPTIAESIDVGRPNACNLCHLDRTLAWAGDALEKWYGAPSTRTLRKGRGLTPDEQSIAAGVLWLTRGDAGQRAIATCALEWDAARATAGTEWTAPYLARLLADPYAAVRYLASRALRRLPDFSSFECDSTVPGPQLAAAAARALDTWSRTTPPERRPKREELLIDPAGRLELERLARLLAQRDDKRVVLAE